MSDTDSQPELAQDQDSSPAPQQLKRLEFVRVAVIHSPVLVFLSRASAFAKDISGPLKPAVQAAESTVTASLGPVYLRVHDVPLQLLQLAERKVDQSVAELGRHVPIVLHQAYEEVGRSGVTAAASSLAKAVVAKYEPTVKEVYAKYEPEVERYVVATWRGLHQLPLIPQLAQIAVPTTVYWADKYNATVGYGKEKGYTIASNLLRIAKVFGPPQEKKVEPVSNGSADVTSQ